MAEVILPAMNRQKFLRFTALAASGLLVDHYLMAADEPSEKFRVALLSDTHLDADVTFTNRGFRPKDNLEKVVALAVAMKPQVTLHNGDGAHVEGLPADYELLKTLMQPLSELGPVHMTMGNHDDRDQFRKIFAPPQTPERRASGRHVSIVETGPVRWIMLDSLYYVNKVAGLLGKNQRTWLANYLQSHTDKPTVLMVHHVPSDSDNDLLDTPLLMQIAQANAHVKAIFYGHSHVFSVKQDGKLHLVNLPACGYNFNDREPVGWMSGLVSSSEIELTLHAIGGNRAQDEKSFKLALT